MKLTSNLNANNCNITGVNNLQISNPGPDEGIEWLGGNNWKIYESPNDLTTNSAGNLQIVQSSTRRATFNTSGQLEIPVATGTAPLSVTSTTLCKNLNVDLLDGRHGSYYQNASNLNAGILPAARFNDTSHGNRGGGSLHAVATTSAAGFMSASDKSKLDGIAAGAEVNQNAYSNITDGTNTASAGSKTDTFKLRSANSILSIAVTNNDATHGDNALFTVNQGSIDHGSIGGLSDDDHTQYAHISTARTITAQHTFNPLSAAPPFILGTNAQGQLVTGLNADQIDGQHASAFALAGHTHDDRYYTETELNTSGGGGQVHWNNITNKPASYTPSAHNHDDRYYTESEADARFVNASGDTMTGNLSIAPAGDAGIELGRTDGVASTPFIDFHSGATAVDYDARIVASGGTGVNAGGLLQVLAAAFRLGLIQINDANTKLLEGSGNAVRMQTNSGYVDVGPQNTAYCHYSTNRPAHLFNKSVYVQGEIYAGSSYNQKVWHAGNLVVSSTAPSSPAVNTLWIDTAA